MSSLQVPHRPKVNGDAHGVTKAVILVSSSIYNGLRACLRWLHHHALYARIYTIAVTDQLHLHRLAAHPVVLVSALCPSTSPRSVPPLNIDHNDDNYLRSRLC